MPPEEECRGRPAAEAELSDDEEIDISTDFSSSAPGHYRGRFPTSPLYTVNEVVYLAIPGQQQPAGP
ncbi:hypothetical protein QBC37DRAFT_380373 [Rhypophila decipiens]|uniref:Uncharacterized protein n=1 Tax=Rhypophila decipiens TaxID=261697 RepID=A0AAN6XX47_9PEZI|nr:hypothetical protein QBC37DRAFT_380373 [Rhypophila decipiens]